MWLIGGRADFLFAPRFVFAEVAFKPTHLTVTFKCQHVGGDAVKVLAWYRPDAGAAVRRHQQDFVERIGAD